MLPKLSIGIPFYGGVPSPWWAHMIQFTAVLAKNVDLVEVITCGSMTADHSRNLIAGDFLKSNAEWLFWIDSDTIVPAGAVERMLAHGRTLVSGLYYGKNPPHPPIAYFDHNKAFMPIDKGMKWEKGEIIKVDAAGMGCMLTHRSVFEDIMKKFEVFQMIGGGLTVVEKKDILGDVETTGGPSSHEHDGKVYKGQLRTRLIKPTLSGMRFPFFMIDHLRTEDMFFFELTRKAGHDLYLDTSIECGHVRETPFTGADYRNMNGH